MSVNDKLTHWCGVHLAILPRQENICFEVLENAKPKLNRVAGQQIFRAKFSAITTEDIQRAMATLVEPNLNESLSVDARQILDLKVGVAFTRFQTKFFQGKYGNLQSPLLSYGMHVMFLCCVCI
jgi:DNA topoisomerase-3